MNVQHVPSWQHMLDEHKECAEALGPLPAIDSAHIIQAEYDVKRLLHHVKYTSKRKTCPRHSQLASVLLMALAPNWCVKDSVAWKLHGIGSDKEKLRTPVFYKAITNGYILINRSGLTPLKWHLSKGAGLPKPNGLAGVPGLRVVHLLDEQGKGFYAEK